MSRVLPGRKKVPLAGERFPQLSPPPMPRRSAARALWGRLTGRRIRFMAIGDAGQAPKVYSFSPFSLGIVLSLAVVGAVSLGVAAYQGIAHQVELKLTQRRLEQIAEDRTRLAEDNQRQAQALRELGGQVKQLGSRLEGVEATAQNLSRLVGAPPPKPVSNPARPRTPASGTQQQTNAPSEDDVDPVAWVEHLLAQTSAQDSQLVANLQALQPAAQSYHERLVHTPKGLPISGRITSGFGWRYNSLLKRQEHHNGVDIAATVGEAVHATADGRVHYAGTIPGYGFAVEIDHGYGYLTLYGHNSRLAVHTGQSVTRGQVIAYAGSTGLSTGPHVHYEIRVNGKAVDPLKFNEAHK